MIIRQYEPSDCQAIAELFYNTVHAVNAADYTREQLYAWASGHVDPEQWNQSFLEHYTLVAMDGETLAGFGDIDESGYLDRLYVHMDYQNRGIGTAICDGLERAVSGTAITVHASITAKPFFEKRGYRTVKKQQVERCGILLTNYAMEKQTAAVGTKPGNAVRKTVLFIAMSLDGYIADSDGSVDWLQGQDEHAEENDSYSVFIKDIDTVIMGWKTYHQIITELSPEEWVYNGLKSYVITRRECSSTEQIRFVHEDPCSLIKRLRQAPGKDIWVCGGASIAGQLMKEDLFDKYYISVIPTILGGGIRLFGPLEKERKLKLTGTRCCNGIIDLIYERRDEH